MKKEILLNKEKTKKQKNTCFDNVGVYLQGLYSWRHIKKILNTYQYKKLSSSTRNAIFNYLINSRINENSRKSKERIDNLIADLDYLWMRGRVRGHPKIHKSSKCKYVKEFIKPEESEFMRNIYLFGQKMDPSNAVGNLLREVEKHLYIVTLKKMKGNKTKTAQMLGVSVKTLFNKVEAYRLIVNQGEVNIRTK